MNHVASEDRAAVLIAAHNEHLTIAATLESVLVSYAASDVFLFDDASDDDTASIAERYLPPSNVIRHPVNIGKSRGLEYALEEHVYPAGYEFVTILDADTAMEPAYRERALEALHADDRVVCAAGQVKSRPDGMNLIAAYRACLYLIWQGVFKRIQSLFNAIAIAPGCSSTWRVSALRQIRFDHRMSTEDFHLSVAAHRLNLGRIVYVPGAVVWTQDPHTIRAFMRQTFRWDRAWWEVVRVHHVGLRWLRRDAQGRLRLSGLDIVNALVVVSMGMFFGRLTLLLVLMLLPGDPPALLFPGGHEALLLHFLMQFTLAMTAVLIAAMFSGRLAMVLLAPAVVVLGLIEFFNTLHALGSVLRAPFPRRPPAGPGPTDMQSSAWESPERREITVPSRATFLIRSPAGTEDTA